MENENTRYLKEKINQEYGKLYSVLSAESHMAIPEMGKYLEIDENNMVVSVKGRSAIRAKKDIPYIILLYHIFIEVFKYGIKHFSECEKEYYQELVDGQVDLIQLMEEIHNGKTVDFSFIERV